MKTILVTIGGKDYHLRSNDEAKLRAVAAIVDKRLQETRTKINDPSTHTALLLTTLNAVEKEVETIQEHKADQALLLQELQAMTDFLNERMDRAL
jgi:cell division protein ZapA (FtsZ GTPase activity inhibitor)